MIIPIVLIVLAVISFAMALKAVKDSVGARPDPAEVDGVLLLIKVPKDNEQGPLGAEMFFSAVHGLLQEDDIETFSFEIVAYNEGVAFYTYIPKKYRKYVEKQIYAQYPSAEIQEAEDYARQPLPDNTVVRGTEIKLEKEYFYSIKTFTSFEVDPLSAITSSVSNLKGIERSWFQMVIKPLKEGWQEAGYDKIYELRKGEKKKKKKTLFEMISGGAAEVGLKLIADVLFGAIASNSHMKEPAKKKEKEKYQMDEVAKKEAESINKKLSLLGFEVNMRIIGMADNEDEALQNVTSIVGALRQFSEESNALNRSGFIKNPEEVLTAYQKRAQAKDEDNIFILNTEELASVYHLPNVSVETPNVEYIRSKKSDSPLDLPIDVSMKFAKTSFRDKEIEFGLRAKDRRRHIYNIGKTGTGKSTMFQNMIIQDIRNGEGLCVIDPHGDLVDYVLDYIPEERLDDVAYFDPSDLEYPVAMNVLELIDPDQKGLVASGLIEVFRKRYEFSWGPRMEHILRNTFLTLLEIPNSTMLGVTRILSDRAYRKYIVNLVDDPMLREFWEVEYEGIAGNEKTAAEAIAPIQNRLGPFLSNPAIRNMMAQAKGTLDLPKIMNEGKVLLVNLSKGKLGEDNSEILGSFLVSRLWFAALTRSSIPEEQRRDFHVYIDEFQNFATSTFASILSESRKYRLNMVLTHQYMSQLETDGSSAVRDAVFGNVGTLMCYVLGQEDAEIMAKEFEPVFDANDIINLGRFHLYMKIMIDNQQSPPFSAVALPPIQNPNGFKQDVIAHSRANFGRPRAKVEQVIRNWSKRTYAPGMDDDLVRQQREEMYRKKVVPVEKEGE